MLAVVMDFMSIFAAKTEIIQQCLFNKFHNTFCDTFAAKVKIIQQCSCNELYSSL